MADCQVIRLYTRTGLAATGKEEHLACVRADRPGWYNYQVLPCENLALLAILVWSQPLG